MFFPKKPSLGHAYEPLHLTLLCRSCPMAKGKGIVFVYCLWMKHVAVIPFFMKVL